MNGPNLIMALEDATLKLIAGRFAMSVTYPSSKLGPLPKIQLQSPAVLA